MNFDFWAVTDWSWCPKLNGQLNEMLLEFHLWKPLEKPMAPHSRTPAWKIPWIEEPGRLQSMGSLGVGHDWADFTLTFHFHALEKEMATHSSVLAWRIPGTWEPGGLPSVGSHRVGHDWSDIAAAAAAVKPCAGPDMDSGQNIPQTNSLKALESDLKKKKKADTFWQGVNT